MIAALRTEILVNRRVVGPHEIQSRRSLVDTVAFLGASGSPLAPAPELHRGAPSNGSDPEIASGVGAVPPDRHIDRPPKARMLDPSAPKTVAAGNDEPGNVDRVASTPRNQPHRAQGVSCAQSYQHADVLRWKRRGDRDDKKSQCCNEREGSHVRIGDSVL